MLLPENLFGPLDDLLPILRLGTNPVGRSELVARLRERLAVGGLWVEASGHFALVAFALPCASWLGHDTFFWGTWCVSVMGVYEFLIRAGKI